ncbi:MAG: sugar phosphate isomerase/epimerase [Calditrichaeota bacterium]|nr:MAG: sugar phosphate isomerase/epimerase [Calditrichota bacterium]
MERRDFLKAAGFTLGAAMLPWASARAEGGAVGVGMCDWNVGTSCDPELIPLAAKAGVEGLQVSVGTRPNWIPLRENKMRQRYVELGKQYQITFHSIAAGGILNDIPLATEPQSAVYVIDALEAAKALGAKNILMAFFGNGDLRLTDSNGEFIERKKDNFSEYVLDSKKISRVVEVLRQIVPRAEDAGVALGLENTLTAAQNLDIIDQVGSSWVQVYYDIGNSTHYGYDVPAELRLLGNDRLCEVHIKDWKRSVFSLEEGEVNMTAAAEALKQIGFNKWYCLETSGREDKFIPDTRDNVAYVKKMFHMV